MQINASPHGPELGKPEKPNNNQEDTDMVAKEEERKKIGVNMETFRKIFGNRTQNFTMITSDNAIQKTDLQPTSAIKDMSPARYHAKHQKDMF